MALNQLTQTLIDNFNTTVKAQFRKGLAKKQPEWQKFAGYMPSTAASNTYAWLTAFTGFVLWTGQRIHKTFNQAAYTVPNDLYTNTMDVKRTDFDDNNLGMFSGIAEAHGETVIDHQNKIMYQLLKDGFSSVCYDGQYFFDTDHPIYPNVDGTGTPVSYSNVQTGTGEPWILLCTSRAVKAVYLQERDPAEFASKTDLTSDLLYEKDMLSWGGRWRGAGAYGFWQLAFGSKAAATEANFDAAYNSMLSVKEDGGSPLGVTPEILLCGPANRKEFEQILLAEYGANGATNTNFKKVELVVCPWLAQ